MTAGEVGLVERHRKEEAQGRDRAVDARRLHAALHLMQLEAAQVLRCRRVRRAANEGRKGSDIANIVVARLLAEGRARSCPRSCAHAAGWQGRAMHRMGGHQGLLSRAEGCWTFDARDRMPRSSYLSVQTLIVAADNARSRRLPPRERVRSSALSGRPCGFRFCREAEPGGDRRCRAYLIHHDPVNGATTSIAKVACVVSFPSTPPRPTD
jgi:hypothetical protein